MVSFKEKMSRLRDFFTFTPGELGAIVVAALVTGFVFSFRDWGVEHFDASAGLFHILAATLAAALILLFRFSCQKIDGLFEGYKVTFKPWWTGYILAVIAAFIFNGQLPLVLIGGVSVAFMVRQRMGEYRYGFSYWNSGIISLWAVYASILAATIFAFLLHIFPGSYFLEKGMAISLVMGVCSLLPLPQVEAFSIYYAEVWVYIVAWLIMILSAVLISSGSLAGLMVIVIAASIVGIIYGLINSEK